MALPAGTLLGPYEILAPIGAGGMGEVYRAPDPRMGRDVAIKVSAERFSDRFSREVHAVAALNRRATALDCTNPTAPEQMKFIYCPSTRNPLPAFSPPRASTKFL